MLLVSIASLILRTLWPWFAAHRPQRSFAISHRSASALVPSDEESITGIRALIVALTRKNARLQLACQCAVAENVSRPL